VHEHLNVLLQNFEALYQETFIRSKFSAAERAALYS